MNALAVKRTVTCRLLSAASDFVSAPASPRPLGVLRIGVCVVLILQALTIAGSVNDLFGRGGLMQWVLGESMIVPGMPRIRWVVGVLEPMGVSEVRCVQGVFLVYVAALSALLVGWHSRIAAVTAWLTHMVLFMANRGAVYGVDDFAHIVLFYCMWFPVGCWCSLDVAAGRTSAEPSSAARLALRVLQLHLAIMYTASGIEKATTPPYQWLDGDVIWRTILLPEYRQFELGWISEYPTIVMLLAWGALSLELGYGLMVWPKLTRKPWAIGIICMHLGIAVFMGLVSFAFFMIVLTTSAFLVPSD
jgi:hypothetical protein